MGLGRRLRGWLGGAGPGRSGGSAGQAGYGGRGGWGGPRQQFLDREATAEDLDHLRRFAASRIGVELYVEPETAVTDTTAVAVATDGEWTRRRVGTPAAAHRLGAELKIPVYDAGVVGYPAAMRRYRRTTPSTAGI